jgi:hypothetical protein
MMHDRCSHARTHVLSNLVHALEGGNSAHSHDMLRRPVAQSAPLYPAAHVHVHDPVVPPGVPCVESQTIVPAVLPSPAVHALAAKPEGIASSMARMPPGECAMIDEASTWLHGMMHDPCSHARMHASS